jgi:hypothetical protein
MYCCILTEGPFGQAIPALELGPTCLRSREPERTVEENKRALKIVSLRDIVLGEEGRCLR